MIGKKQRLNFIGLSVLGVLAGSSAIAGAQSRITAFDSSASSATLTHIEDDGASTPQETNVTVTAIPAVSPKTFQLNQTYNASTVTGPSSTVGKASIYEITSSGNLGLALSAGTGVTQTNVPGKAFTGASETDVNFTGVWDIGAAGFPASGHLDVMNYSFPLGGTVGISGQDEFDLQLSFFDPASDSPLATVNLPPQIFTNNTTAPKPFTSLVSGSVLLQGGLSIPAFDQLIVMGTIDFKATNDSSPSDISLTQDATFSVGDPAAPLPAPAAMGIVLMGILGASRYCRKTAE